MTVENRVEVTFAKTVVDESLMINFPFIFKDGNL